MAGDPSAASESAAPSTAPTVAISNAMVRIQRDYVGRGPTKVRTSVRDNTVIVMMEDMLTRAEQSLVNDGKIDLVLETRASFQGTMRSDMIAAVEEITGRSVVAFMSTNHVDPDIACEILMLAPHEAGEEPFGSVDVIAGA